MRNPKLLFTLFIIIFPLTKSLAQDKMLVQADQKYDLLHVNAPINEVRTKVNTITQSSVDLNKIYGDSTRWTVNFTTLNTDYDEFGPIYFKGGLIITSNRHPKQAKYSSGSNSNSFTNLYFIKDNNSIKKISLHDETNHPQNIMAMTRGKTDRPGINNNSKIGNFYVKSSIETAGISEVEVTPATLLKGVLKSKLNDGPLSFPADESWAMFTRNKDANSLQLFSASQKDGKWVNLESFMYNSNAYSTGHPSLSADGKTLFFVSNMPGGYGGTDLYYCIRMGNSWTKPVNLGSKVNTSGDEMFPFLDSQNNLYFSSNGLLGLGGLDIFYIQLKEFLPSGEVKNLGYPLNSKEDDFGIVTMPNGLSGYFSSDRRGNDDIYQFDAVPSTKPQIETVKVSNLSVSKPIAKAPDGGSVLNTQIATTRSAKPEGLKEYNERGIALLSNDKNIGTARLTALHQTAAIGSVVKITNAINGKSTNAEVVGRFPASVIGTDAIVLLNKATADWIGAYGKRFQVIIGYGGDQIKEVPFKLAAKPVKSEKKPVPVKANPVMWAVKTVTAPKNIMSAADTVNGSRISITENISAITTIAASDADAGTKFSYSLNGGVDMAKFRINSNTGALTFVSAPNFEKPADADGNSSYIAVLRASDGTNITDLTIIVTITDVNDNAPIIISNAAVSIPENAGTVTTIKASDADAGTTLSYNLSGGADMSKFLINSSSGALTFISTPDFERPADSDNNNTYILVVRASDGTHTADQTVIVTVSDINDSHPVITSNATVSVPENRTAIHRITTTDADAGATFGYSLSGGADVDKFIINSSTGAIMFISAPDFEKPSDTDANNNYVAIVRVSDGINTTDQTVVITVTDINDNAPLITSNAVVSIPENTTDVRVITAIDADAGSSFTYSLSGGVDVVKFRINSSNGALTFISGPDFEKPADAGVNNTYSVMVRANDGAKTSDQMLTVTINDVNDNIPVITSNATISIPENNTAITTIRSTDVDAGSTFSYSLSGGADAALFNINSNSGVLTFISPSDYEKPGDADSNNKYIVVIRVSDGANIADQTVIATVTDVNDNAPVIKLN